MRGFGGGARVFFIFRTPHLFFVLFLFVSAPVVVAVHGMHEQGPIVFSVCS